MSDMMKDPMVLRQLIMDHYQYPRNKGLSTDQGYQQVHMDSESCIDDIMVQAKIEDGTLVDIRFDGIACTISTASTSMMSELLKGKKISEAKMIIDEYFKMIENESHDEELLAEAIAFSNVYKQPNRIKCATIGWNAIKTLIDKGDSNEKR